MLIHVYKHGIYGRNSSSMKLQKKKKKKKRENDEQELMSKQNGLISSVKSGLSHSWVMWFFMELLGFTAQISKCLGAMACQI